MNTFISFMIFLVAAMAGFVALGSACLSSDYGHGGNRQKGTTAFGWAFGLMLLAVLLSHVSGRIQ